MFQFRWNLCFAQTECGEFNGDNSFLLFLIPVNIYNCQYWYLLSFRPQFSTKNSKCSSFDEILYFTQNESGEFNGFDIERCKLVHRELKLGIENPVSKILLLHYKQNWWKIMAYLSKFVLLMQIMSTQLLI